ncbi:NfeD family protein [Rhizobium sp. L1K21]|uniref:NfeD family protein n=1 Tax=Rhizobium sp. L1K21 TaxID=2954933 RepID=UPI0020928B62|nr:NfeD family protein [Rhizobium sp. L1K21]MCO6185034.1 NfeD family protein [Rhizobium sp. L1K21]
MIASLVRDLGPWVWWVLGAVLLILELAVPGVFLMWIGAAAIITGAVSLLVWSQNLWSWEIQLLVFAALSFGCVIIGRRYFYNSNTETDEPMLNRRTDGLVGRTAVLVEAISEGQGRIKLDDTVWLVNGPDLPAGSRVRIVSSKGTNLVVEVVETV